MANVQDYPYATHLNTHYGPLELVDVPALVAACTDRWYNQTLCRVNDSVVRLGVGRRLVRAVVAAARGRFGSLRLRTESREAAAFYEGLGFRPVCRPDCTHTLELKPEE